MRWFTPHWSEGPGASIDAVGGPLPALTVTVSMSKAVPGSVTLRRTW